MTTTKSRYKTLDLLYVALGAVLITLCSWINIPTLVPFTMQTFAVFCVLSLLGGKRGTAAILLYLILGAVGIPVFAQFTAGLGIILGSTGGYMVGFIFTGLLYWLATRLWGTRLWVEIAALSAGLLAVYAFGTAWFMVVYTRTDGPVGLSAALLWCVTPFIVPDLVKLGLALTLSRRLAPLLRLRKAA